MKTIRQIHQNTILVLVMLLSFQISAFALAPSQLQNEELIDELAQQVQRNHHSMGYKSARKTILGYLYLDQNNNSYTITDVYCEDTYQSPGPNRIPNNNIINVEHTWPQSKFGGRDRGAQKSDLHHLFPTDSQLNSSRSNYPFGVVEDSDGDLKCQESKRGRNKYGERVFEPPQAHKGNVARALFYFSVRYGLHIDSHQEEFLRQWHKEDPVDAEESALNLEIKDLQGNSNPFITHPAYVDQISDF